MLCRRPPTCISRPNNGPDVPLAHISINTVYTHTHPHTHTNTCVHALTNAHTSTQNTHQHKTSHTCDCTVCTRPDKHVHRNVKFPHHVLYQPPTRFPKCGIGGHCAVKSSHSLLSQVYEGRRGGNPIWLKKWIGGAVKAYFIAWQQNRVAYNSFTAKQQCLGMLNILL